MDKQALEAREQMKSLSGREKLINFWYYYKVHIFAAIFVIVIVAFTAVECARNIKYDLQISYYSTVAIDTDGVTKLAENLKEAVDDINLNGSTDVQIAPCFANLDEASEQTQAVYVKFTAELAAGEAMGYIVDERFLEMFKKGYAESAEDIVEITNSPVIKKYLKLPEGQKLYWVTKTLYEKEKGKDESVAAHKNALKVEEYLKTGKLPEKAKKSE